MISEEDKLELDDTAQDASFFCDDGHWRELQPRHVYPVILVRFSAFGSLVTITTADEIEPALVRRLAAALEAAGYTYVVAEELDEPYDGKNPHIGQQSWWVRFFDYL